MPLYVQICFHMNDRAIAVLCPVFISFIHVSQVVSPGASYITVFRKVPAFLLLPGGLPGNVGRA